MGNLTANFDGDVAIVTGASSGIGLEVARRLSEAGASVHGFDVRPPAAELGAGTVFHEVDLRSTSAVDRAVEQVLEREGRVDLLVNNAGVARDSTLWKLTDDEWQEVLDTNLGGAYRVLRAVARAMRARRHGRIVQVASINGLRGKFGQANYCASKAGLIGLTRAAARELGPRGITVNAVAPGMTETAMTRGLASEVREAALAETATGRTSEPADVAGAILFLLSEQAAQITGTVLPVDGGQMA